MFYCARNLHRAQVDQDAKRPLRNKKVRKVRKLTTLLNSQDHTHDFEDNFKIGPAKKDTVMKLIEDDVWIIFF